MFKCISIITSLSFIIVFNACGNKYQHELNKTYNVVNEQACNEKDGYWYKGKCWANFEEFDDGIAKAAIDSVVASELEIASNYKVSMGEKSYQVGIFIPEESKKITYFVGKFDSNDNIKSFLIQFEGKAKPSGFDADATIIQGDIFNEDSPSLSTEEMKKRILATGKVKGKGVQDKEREFIFSGNLKNIHTNQSVPFTIQLGDGIYGIGDTSLEVKGNKAILNGTLGTKTYQQMRSLIENHPEVHTIVLDQVPGSINDAVNMHTGRLIREAGLTTELMPTSVIASGGVDIFCAGKERKIAKGAQLGIHSWGGGGFSGGDLPKDHPAHQYQIAYFVMCLGKEKGPAFYFKTLEAAPANEMYWMTQDDIEYWELATMQ